MGGCLGFASMNFHSILMDLFGVSLMSVNPHQEVVDQYDARRHGGGMGAWLGIWTWCWIGSLATGFFVGAVIIDNYTPAWGFYVSIIIIAVVLFLNVVCPETRRSAYRRSVAEVRTGKDISRRVAKGEIMMHRTKTGPRWWGQEVYHGIILSFEMLRQPGFLVMAIYSAWIYAQVLLLIILLGSLASKYYDLRPTMVGLLVFMIAIGAFLAVPFQKANLFSRSRLAQLNTSSATLDRRVSWSSHMVRRTVFTILLPITGICYAAVSSGPSLPVALPTLFATAFGFLSCLAISECNGFIFEAFDCSDLSPGMTGRQRGSTARHPKKTNYSSFPRVTAGFAVIHTFSFILAAASTALGGRVTRTLGQQVSTGVVAGILLILTIILLMVLIRFVEVKIVPSCKLDEMDKIIDMRRKSTLRRTSMPNDLQAVIEEEKAWRPAMIGNPIGKTRRMNIFELGSLTRWQEIRKKNRLIDSGVHAHLNRTAWNQGLDALDDQMSDFKRDAQEFLHIRGKGKGHRRVKRSNEDSEDLDFSSYSMSDQGPAKSRKIRTPRDGSMNQIIDGARETHGV
ncbi:Putative Major facilitator superfamily transporter [[Torrubiella] hemipterigena]|uniref:Putative Major facilitator superfamily transporter n=1 Tax=[Torrubiella] hemipterigena TaxID=1531966 RepID=A0A0A1TRL3_9HYPO|nr:Putative Major facilitator superfamily transporter [[Torrubiella] hemipterigena]